MFKIPIFGFTCLGFLAVCVILAIAAFLVLRSGEQGKTKLSGCAGCAIGLALCLVAGVALCTFLFVAFLGAKSEVIRRGPVKSFEWRWDDHDHHDDEWDGRAEEDAPLAEAEPTFDSKHAVHLLIEMEGGDPTAITRWLRDSTEGDFTIAIHQDGDRTKIDIGLPISRHDVEELKRELEREFDSLRLPSGARIEIKDPDEDD